PSPIAARRVVITGMSLGCALGFELEEYWRNLLAGKSGIRTLPWIPEDSPLPTKYAGWIDDEMVKAATARYQIDDPDRPIQLALFAAGRALEDAGLRTDGAQPLDMEVIAGTGHGNTIFHNETVEAFTKGGYRKTRPTAIVRIMFNRMANIVSIRYRLTGVSYVVSCACASSSVAVGNAFNQIRTGLAERVLALGVDSALDPATFSVWNRLGVLTKHSDPATASRPFDRNRTGLVMGEGASGFVLESLDSARARGARIIAEIAGYGTSSDAGHIVVPDAAGQVKAIRRALDSAGVKPSDLDYVNAHGTSTLPADKVESASLIEALGDAGRGVPVSNTKAQLGHLMGATAGVELVTTLLALQKGLIPPCRNLDDPDPECPLNFVRHEPLKKDIRIALKNSFAFGGTNCVLIVRRFEE
ncbi:MAG TPA: beta-ketoacyl-[acyl-carrier-protein] synthase II, partial [Verrucomicrobiales bacterium]|nr:beta-ketoacyl-[acyl-carrier-protein] synthase II [Verrucomicrobiales bacterium]